jgi:hypothetical protein
MHRGDQQTRWLICSALAALVFLAGAASVLGFGGPRSATGYPTVTVYPPTYGPPVTDASGAVERRPVKPTKYVSAPSKSCEWVGYASGPGRPAHAVLSPPTPGLRATAISKRTVVLKFWFVSLPKACHPVSVLVSITANDAPGAMPLTETVALKGKLRGSAVLTYESPRLPPPDVALASALTKIGGRSRVARVLVKR